MAIMQNESGGTGNDPMQCSESPLNTEYPQRHNGITDPEYSINIGIKYFESCLRAAKCKSPDDVQEISLALQGYNFGNGYINTGRRKKVATHRRMPSNSHSCRRRGWNGTAMVTSTMSAMCFAITARPEAPEAVSSAIRSKWGNTRSHHPLVTVPTQRQASTPFIRVWISRQLMERRSTPANPGR